MKRGRRGADVLMNLSHRVALRSVTWGVVRCPPTMDIGSRSDCGEITLGCVSDKLCAASQHTSLLSRR
jgi:hypothetical protein